tara:strand:+ start:123 stop:314 length:192 start_codon:yes stop_codon:yes gene_type:complete
MAHISQDDVNTIAHINSVTNGLHDLSDELYEDLMDRQNDKAKETAQHICKLMAELIQSLSDDI